MTFLERVKKARSFSKPRKQLHIAILSIIRSNGKMTPLRLKWHLHSVSCFLKMGLVFLLVMLFGNFCYALGHALPNNSYTRHINIFINELHLSAFSAWSQHYLYHMQTDIDLSNTIGTFLKQFGKNIVQTTPILFNIFLGILVIYVYSRIFIDFYNRKVRKRNYNYYTSFSLNELNANILVDLSKRYQNITAYLFNNYWLLFDDKTMNYLGAISATSITTDEIKHNATVVYLNNFVVDTDNQKIQIDNKNALKIANNLKHANDSFSQNKHRMTRQLIYNNYKLNRVIKILFHCLFVILYIADVVLLKITWDIYAVMLKFHANLQTDYGKSLHLLKFNLFSPVFDCGFIFLIMTAILIIYTIKTILHVQMFNKFKSLFDFNNISIFDKLNDIYKLTLLTNQIAKSNSTLVLLYDQYVVLCQQNKSDIVPINIVPYGYISLKQIKNYKVINMVPEKHDIFFKL